MGADLEIEGLTQLTEIGRGGSARVFRAFQNDLDRVVAVKVLHSSWDDEVQHRFDRERRAMGRLSDHPGIVPIYAIGETASGEPYLVMPYYDRGSLADAMAGDEPMPWQRATALIAAVAETIGSAHDQGIIHCDIKPANIMMHENGQPKVADFGISRTSGTASTTRQTALTFTPAYSPPEVFTDSARAPSVDIYGMGATFFAMLAGRPPFHGTGPKPDVMAIINRVAHKPVEDLRDSIPPEICEFVERTMAKDPLDRPQNVKEFLGELRTAVRAASGSGKTAASGSGNTAANSTTNRQPQLAPVPLRSISVKQSIAPLPRPAPGFVPAPRRRLLGPSGIAAVLIGTVLLGGLLAIWSLDRGSTVVASPATTEASEPTEPTISGTAPASEASTGTTRPATTSSEAEPPPSNAPSLIDPPSSNEPQEAVLDNDALDNDDVPEIAPPLISGLAVSDVTETSATITFGTNECAAAEVRFVSSGATQTVKSSRCSKNHSFNLADLAPDTSYEVSVIATVAGVSTSGATSFMTPAVNEPDPPAAPVVSNLRLVTIGETSAVVAFNTDLCSTSAVITIVGTLRNESCSTSHQYEVGTAGRALTPSSRYVVLIEATANDLTTSASLSFTTLDVRAPPAPKPEITSISVVDITTNSARVVFQTDQCTGMVFSVSDFGSGERGYPRVNECWTTHQIRLGEAPATSGPLLPGVSYTVTVTARAQDGTTSQTRSVSFDTLGTPPVTDPEPEPEPTTTTEVTEPDAPETTADAISPVTSPTTTETTLIVEPSTIPETSVPETTVPETTVPETTVPETTVPETTVPDETTVP